MFKIGDYAIHDKYRVVIHITREIDKLVMNAQEGYRKATECEIEQYHEEW